MISSGFLKRKDKMLFKMLMSLLIVLLVLILMTLFRMHYLATTLAVSECLNLQRNAKTLWCSVMSAPPTSTAADLAPSPKRYTMMQARMLKPSCRGS